MFFDGSAAAFANIGKHLRPGGRIVFACWQPLNRNPWFVGPVLAPYLGAPPPPGDAQATHGAFSLGDPELLSDILHAAEFVDVEVDAKERTADTDSGIDDVQLLAQGVAANKLVDARAAVERHRAQFSDARGTRHITLAVNIVTARRR